MKLTCYLVPRRAALAGTFLAAVLLAGGCGSAPAARPLTPTPIGAPPAAKVVWNGSYARDIQPMFNEKCVGCHGPSRAENGLRLDSYDNAMKGTQFGRVIVPGSSTTSALVSVVRGTADPSIRMPHGGQRLTDQQVQNIVLWIDAGARSN